MEYQGTSQSQWLRQKNTSIFFWVNNDLDVESEKSQNTWRSCFWNSFMAVLKHNEKDIRSLFLSGPHPVLGALAVIYIPTQLHSMSLLTH